MVPLNWLFTISSLTVLLVTIERYSFTTKVLLDPFDFFRLHEVVQMCLIILLTVIVPFLVLREVSGNFDLVKKGRGLILFLLFIIGVYFYSTGNGVHELASFLFNHYCDTENFSDNLCGGFFFNDYYFGNILYFIGGILMTVPLLLLENMKQFVRFSRSQTIILLINAFLYSLAIFAYSGFDRVLVGLVYSLINMISADLQRLGAIAIRSEELPEQIEVNPTIQGFVHNFKSGIFEPASFVLPPLLPAQPPTLADRLQSFFRNVVAA